MIHYVKGDIFTSHAQTVVNPVNTVGIMGKGLALQFKQRYPDMFAKYKSACESHQLTIGKLMLCHEADRQILLFPTKIDWRNPSKLEYIENGLEKFVATYTEKGITSIAFPPLGCGNGNLNWHEVMPVMEKYLSPLPIDIYIYTPDWRCRFIERRETMSWSGGVFGDTEIKFYCHRNGNDETKEVSFNVCAKCNKGELPWISK